MTKKIQLKDICYARSGDKGDVSNIGLMAFDEQKYELLKKHVTPEKVKAHFKDWCNGPVEIYPMDNILALQIVLRRSLGGGVATSLRFDGTGKVMGSALLRMEIEDK